MSFVINGINRVLKPMSMNLAYLTQGKLHLKLGQTPVSTIKSEFGQSVQERMQQIQRRQVFRNRGVMANFMPPQMLRSIEEQDEPLAPIVMTSVCRGTEGKFFYSLEVGTVTGIFAFNPTRTQEDRLFHGSDFRVRHLDFHPEKNLLACTLLHKDGTANIAIMPLDSSRIKDMTEGDSIDLAPRWIPGAAKALVFQSAGIGRDRSGFVVDQGPFTIEKLDFDQQEVTCLASDPKYDLLGPQITADGTLYYIRRPYQPLKQRITILGLLRDILLIPFRLLYAIYQWLNFFTWRYTGKPLRAAGGPQSPELKQQLTAWGQMIDVEKATRGKVGDIDAPALVPRTWQLVRQRPGSDLELVSEGVLSFDIMEDGTIVYANGSAIYMIQPDGTSERLLVDRLIEQVAIIAGV